jgi:hypothetical protein
MPADRSAPAEGLAALDILVGAWTEQVLLPDIPPGRVVFEWALDGHYLLQHSEIPQSEFPNSLAVIARDTAGDGYVQHYFDSRGVVRIYQMSLRDALWTLSRTEPDFTPLAFAQRFEGRFAPDGYTIAGRWETSEDGGEHWKLDFPLTFTRVS